MHTDDPHSGRRVVSLSKIHLPPRVLVILRKRWLRPDMTEKNFNWDVKQKRNETNKEMVIKCK